MKLFSHSRPAGHHTPLASAPAGLATLPSMARVSPAKPAAALTVLALGLAALTLTGCTEYPGTTFLTDEIFEASPAPKKAKPETTYGLEEGQILLKDGRLVTCVLYYTASRPAGLSCDWQSARTDSEAQR